MAALLGLVAISAASSSRGGAIALTGLVPAYSLTLSALIVIVMVQMAQVTMDRGGSGDPNSRYEWLFRATPA